MTAAKNTPLETRPAPPTQNRASPEGHVLVNPNIQNQEHLETREPGPTSKQPVPICTALMPKTWEEVECKIEWDGRRVSSDVKMNRIYDWLQKCEFAETSEFRRKA